VSSLLEATSSTYETMTTLSDVTRGVGKFGRSHDSHHERTVLLRIINFNIYLKDLMPVLSIAYKSDSSLKESCSARRCFELSLQ
jgi:hypothetical protein